MKKNNSNCQTVRIKVKNENHRVKLAKLIPNCAMTLKKHMTMATDAHSYKRHTHQKINWGEREKERERERVKTMTKQQQQPTGHLVLNGAHQPTDTHTHANNHTAANIC